MVADPNSWTFTATRAFWKAFEALPAGQKSKAEAAFQKFRTDPFDPSLGAHKIIRLSALWGKTIYSVKIGDLRAVFYIQGSEIVSVDIGTHAIYK